MSEPGRDWTITNGVVVHHVNTVAEFDAALDQLHMQARDRPSLATITSPDGVRVLIGVGGAESVLQISSNDDPPYMVTVGDPAAEGVAAFDFEGQNTEIRRRHLVPAESARHAALTFFETGVTPNSVRWEEL